MNILDGSVKVNIKRSLTFTNVQKWVIFSQCTIKWYNVNVILTGFSDILWIKWQDRWDKASVGRPARLGKATSGGAIWILISELISALGNVRMKGRREESVKIVKNVGALTLIFRVTVGFKRKYWFSLYKYKWSGGKCFSGPPIPGTLGGFLFEDNVINKP